MGPPLQVDPLRQRSTYELLGSHSGNSYGTVLRFDNLFKHRVPVLFQIERSQLGWFDLVTCQREWEKTSWTTPSYVAQLH